LATLTRSSLSNDEGDDDDEETGRTIPSNPINDLGGDVLRRDDLDAWFLASSPALLRSLTSACPGRSDDGTGRTRPSVPTSETELPGEDDDDALLPSLLLLGSLASSSALLRSPPPTRAW
jgi:hypothetical protein